MNVRTLSIQDVRRKVEKRTDDRGLAKRIANWPYLLTRRDLQSHVDSIHENARQLAIEDYNHTVGIMFDDSTPSRCPCVYHSYTLGDPLKMELRLLL